MARIRKGEGKSPYRTTIRDIALRSGVSVATVSRVLNDRPDVSDDTRETVLRQIRDDGYTTNRSARGLATRRADLVGLTLPVVQAEYFGQIVSGAAEALYKRDVRFVLCPTLYEHDREVSLLNRLMHGTTDGAMLVLPSETDFELTQLHRNGYPFVVVDPREYLNVDVPVVSATHLQGARAAMEHLIGLGHRRIGAITGPPGWCATVDRLDGYRSALLAAELPVDPELVCEGDFLLEGGYRGASHLIDLAQPPTAIFAFNDTMAIGALRAARERGLRVPQDLSVIGFDGAEVSLMVEPLLTTVRQPLQEMGRVAASLLLRMLDGQPLEAMRLQLATRLVVRDSTVKPSELRSNE